MPPSTPLDSAPGIYITYQIKKRVYNKKACLYIYVGGCLDKYISAITWPPKQKFLTPLLVKRKTPLDVKSYLCKQNVNLEFKKSKQYLERKKKNIYIYIYIY